MSWESFNLFYKKQLWFLQTHLQPKEIFRIKLMIHNNLSSNASMETLLKRIHLEETRLKNLLHRYEEKELSISCYEKQILTRFELEFLTRKRLHEACPLALNFLGNKNILKKPLVAIIGSRKPTFYGREQAYYFAKELAKKGCTIISGGAIGIDCIANEVALQQNQGGSCAILGSGLKQTYPPSNLFLFQQLQQSPFGMIISEFWPDESPKKWNFPKRNHTIALLADFVLVIEAAPTSGSLITANAALDYGTDVGALPGPVDGPNSLGTNSLIQRGAFCIQSPQDVIERVHSVNQQRIL